MDPSLICNSTSANPAREWCVKSLRLNHVVMCYKQTLTQTEGLWRAENATNLSVPTFLYQLIIIICVNRLLIVAFRALRLPRIAAEILGGVILGAGGVAHTLFGQDYLYPYRSIMTLETLANLSLVYYMFLVGLEVDMKPIMQAPKKAFTTAFAGFAIPFPVGYALHYLMVKNFDVVTKGYPTRHGPLFWGVALSTTNFPDLAQILSDRKLLRSEVGRTALSAAVITDFFSWLLLVVSMAIVNNSQVYTVVFAAAFVAFSLLVLRPALEWAVRRASHAVDAAGGYNDYHLSFLLALVVVFGYATDACGCHSIFGGFMLGLIMPKGELKERLMEKVEDFISGLMMPLFFGIIGLRTNHTKLFAGQFGVGTIAAILGIAFVAKIFSTFVTAVFVNKMKPRDGLALGVLMNTKGLLALIVISSARDFKVLTNETFTMINTAMWLMTVAVGPILSLTHRFAKPAVEGKRRTIASLEPHSEFRILTCFHSSREVTGVINLLDASNPTRNSPVLISAVHLVENVGRASAMLIVHDTCKTGGGGAGGDDKEQLELSAAASAFEGLKVGREGGTISVEALTAVSAYATMHEDICSLALEKHASLVILPFQLKPAADGGVDGSSHDPLRGVNKSVMESARCSVAVLVDRGHRPPAALARLNSLGARHRSFFMLFVGGPDDREALAYARRMSGNPGVSLTVTRFVTVSEDHVELGTDGEGIEKMLDESSIEEFRHRTGSNKSVSFTEVAVRDGDEVVRAVNAMEGDGFDLIIVGRGKGRDSRLAMGSAEWSEFPELGVLGDTLVCSSFAANAWILVVQQGGGGGGGGGVSGRSASSSTGKQSGKLGENLGHTTWQPRNVDRPDLAPFVCRGNKAC